MSRRPTTVAAAAFCAILFCTVWAPPAAAGTVIVPGMPTPPQVGLNGLPLAALRVNMSGIASADLFGFPPGADSFSESNTEFVEPGEFGTFLNVNHAINVTAGDNFSAAVGAANTGFGRLSASATALTTIPGPGLAQARASVATEFIDVLELDPNNPNDMLNLSSTWNVNGSITGAASAFGQVWIFPFGPFPPPGGQFLANFYKAVSLQPGAVPADTLLGSLSDLPRGTKLWIYGRLDVFAARTAAAGISVADFSHTAQLFIDPAPGTPAGAFTTASGADYTTPVPEPTSLNLLAAIGLLLPRRRR
jgi:hypothetical protein